MGQVKQQTDLVRWMTWCGAALVVLVAAHFALKYAADMSLSLQLTQALSGLSRGITLFLIASGLSLIFGVMNILNFAHVTLWLVGGYFCWAFVTLLGGAGVGTWLSILLGAMAVGVVGMLIEVFLIRRVYSRTLPEQLLLTFALVLILSDLIKIVFKPGQKELVKPAWLSGATEVIEGAFVGHYEVFLILFGFAVFVGLIWFLNKTRYGHIIKASVFSREMVSALGIPVPIIFTGVFVLGTAIAGLAGGVQGFSMGQVALGMDHAWVIQAFCVVVIGGFGSLGGTLVGALIVGMVYSFAIEIWEFGAMMVVFVVTAVVLIVRPWGLFGTPMRH